MVLKSFGGHIDPFNNLDNLFSNASNLLFDAFDENLVKVVTQKSEFPRTNYVYGEEGCNLEIEAPGLIKEDITISYKEPYLSVSASKENKKEYSKREFRYDKWKITFDVPKEYNIEGLKANVENGILHVEIPATKEFLNKNKKTVFEVK